MYFLALYSPIPEEMTTFRIHYRGLVPHAFSPGGYCEYRCHPNRAIVPAPSPLPISPAPIFGPASEGTRNVLRILKLRHPSWLGGSPWGKLSEAAVPFRRRSPSWGEIAGLPALL